MLNIVGAHVISPAVAGLAVMALFVYIPCASDNGFGAWSLPTLLAGHRA
jgi:hypothetical protein